MATRDDFLRMLDDGYKLIESYELRQTRVIIRKRVWSGGAHGVGTPTVTDLELSPRPKVQEQDGFRSEGSGIAVVGPITPAYAGGGYTLDQLIPSRGGAGIDHYYRLVGPRGTTKYSLGTLDASRPMRYMLRLVALDRPDELADY